MERESTVLRNLTVRTPRSDRMMKFSCWGGPPGPRGTCWPADDASKSTSVGVAAHITAASPGGPRYDANLTSEMRRSPQNGIWLCETCARRIDGDESQYLTGVLRLWKSDSEEVVEREVGQPAEPSPDLQPIRYSAIGLSN